MASRSNLRVVVPDTGRTRSIQTSAGYGWVDARLLRDGWLPYLRGEDVAVYVFLCLVADRQGVSWYRRDRIRSALGLDEPAVWDALQRLQSLGLIAYQPFHQHASEGFRQVLAVPLSGPTSVEPSDGFDEL